MEEKNKANAFQTSPTAAVRASLMFPSFTRGAVLAMNSTKPGSTCFVHSTRIGLPKLEAAMSVLEQCAAVRVIACAIVNYPVCSSLNIHTSSSSSSFCIMMKQQCSTTGRPNWIQFGTTVKTRTAASMLFLTFLSQTRPCRPLCEYTRNWTGKIN